MKNLKRMICMLLTLVMVFALCACGSTAAPAKTETPTAPQEAAPAEEIPAEEAENPLNAPDFVTSSYKLNICTATSSGIFYAGGTALAQLWQEQIPGYMTSASSSSGSGENITLLANNEANVAFIQSDYLLNSYNGWGPYEGDAHSDFRVLCPMFLNHYNLMITENSPISCLADVKGKRVVTGRAGSGTLSATEAILSTFGITLDDIIPSYLDQAQSVESLRNGLADFALAAGAIPMAAVTDAMTGNSNIRLLGLSDEEIAALLADHSWLLEMEIPANTYDNQPETLKTVGHNSYLVVNADMPDDVAYRLVMTMYENKDWLTSTLASFDNECFNNPTVAVESIGVPMHPGAEAAFKDLGFLG